MYNIKMKKIIAVLFLLILIFWSVFIEPNMLAVNHLNLKSKDLKGLKIIFVGDFHVKKNQRKNLIRIVNKINEQNPDLILIAGDFVNGHNEKDSMPIEEISKELSKLKSKYGIYSVLGNHDWWQNGEKIKFFLEKNGILVLEDENSTIKIGNKKLCIIGVEDITTRKIEIEKAFKNASSPSIFLTHSPDTFPLITNKKPDLVLAGHTHGGQVTIPFIGALVVPSDYGRRYAQGLIEENNKTMFVTKGIGTSILPIRFNCIPEIVVINFL